VLAALLASGPSAAVRQAQLETRQLEAQLHAAQTYEDWRTLARRLSVSERKLAALKDAGSLLPWRRAASRRSARAAAAAARLVAESAPAGASAEATREEAAAAAEAAAEEVASTSSRRISYDRELVEERLHLLRASRASGDVGEMMFALRADLLRSLGNVTDLGRRLHEPEHAGMPQPVADYLAEVRQQLKLIVAESELRPEEKLSFLQETRHCFGRTALLLSGGGTLGAFHIGVVRALVRARLLPRVLAGSSVGSVVASIVATRTAEELRELFADDASFRAQSAGNWASI